MEADKVSELLGRIIVSENARLDKMRRTNNALFFVMGSLAILAAGLLIAGAVTGL